MPRKPVQSVVTETVATPVQGESRMQEQTATVPVVEQTAIAEPIVPEAPKLSAYEQGLQGLRGVARIRYIALHGKGTETTTSLPVEDDCQKGSVSVKAAFESRRAATVSSVIREHDGLLEGGMKLAPKKEFKNMGITSQSTKITNNATLADAFLS